MQHFAFIEGAQAPASGTVREVIMVADGLVIGVDIIHPSIAAKCVACDATVTPGMVYDGHAFAAAPGPSLADVQAAKIATLTLACQATIMSGFTSSALGAPYSYPSQITDQINLMACVTESDLSSTPAGTTWDFWCGDASGAWSKRAHTAAQIQQAGKDGKAAIIAAQTKLTGSDGNGGLVAQVKAATTIAAVNAITW